MNASSQGEKIALTARLAMGATWATDVAGWCSRFVRQVLEQAGVKTGGLFKGNAIETEKAFLAAGRAVPAAQAGPLQVGAVLFQGFGSPDENGTPQGHTGIYIGGGQVAQNTTIGSKAGGPGGKKILPLASFGRYTSVAQPQGGAAVTAVDPYGAYAAGGLPTPLTGAAARSYALSSGSDSVDGRAANLNAVQRAQARLEKDSGGHSYGWGVGVDRAINSAASPLEAVKNIGSYLAARGADVGLALVALLLLLLGAWAAIQGGK